MRIVFYGHADKHNLTDVFWSKDDLPSRDAFLASLGKFAAQHHKIAITHARGRIDPAKVRVYVLPGGSLAKEEGGLCGLKVEKGVEGLVTTGDVVRVLNGVDVDEGVWRGEVERLRGEGGMSLLGFGWVVMGMGREVRVVLWLEWLGV